MSSNLSGNDIANGDFMIKTCAADPEGGYAKEKFHADPKNGIIISEVDGPKGKRLEFSADWSVVSLDTKLQKGDNIEISEDQQTGKVEISSPNVGKVKTFAGDTFKYLLDALANVSDDEIIIAQGLGEHAGQVILAVPNVGKVKTDSEDTFGYLKDKIFGTFPIIKKQISLGGGVKSVVIESAEKIAFGQFDAKWSDESYDKGNYETKAVIVGRISNDTIGLSGVNFCVAEANPATFKIEYANLSGSTQSLNLYVTTDISDWSDAELFTVELETTAGDEVKTAEVEINGLGDYPLYFLLVSDEYGEEVEGITIFDIYKY